MTLHSVAGPEVRVKLTLPPSVNHCYERKMRGGRLIDVLTPEASEWLDTATATWRSEAERVGWQVPDPGCLVVVELYGIWPNHLRRDIHNLHKLLADSTDPPARTPARLRQRIGPLVVDDQWVLLRDMDFRVDKDEAGLYCRAYLKDGGR